MYLFLLYVKLKRRSIFKSLVIFFRQFRVGLGNVEVPDEVYNELAKAYDEGGDVPEWDDELENAKEWLSDNIREADAMEWEYEIDDFQDE